MFEILTKEHVEKMSNRELSLSEYYYQYNLNQIQFEINERNKPLDKVKACTHNEILGSSPSDLLLLVHRKFKQKKN